MLCQNVHTLGENILAKTFVLSRFEGRNGDAMCHKNSVSYFGMRILVQQRQTVHVSENQFFSRHCDNSLHQTSDET